MNELEELEGKIKKRAKWRTLWGDLSYYNLKLERKSKTKKKARNPSF
jgi:hypothetical protein